MKQISALSILLLVFCINACNHTTSPEQLKLNELEYLEMTGLNVMLAHDFYPEGHQGV
jgi:endoglucanase